MYSCGVVLLQAAFPMLRSDTGIINFNAKLEGLKWVRGRRGVGMGWGGVSCAV
jgi:hypothetical protein